MHILKDIAIDIVSGELVVMSDLYHSIEVSNLPLLTGSFLKHYGADP